MKKVVNFGESDYLAQTKMTYSTMLNNLEKLVEIFMSENKVGENENLRRTIHS